MRASVWWASLVATRSVGEDDEMTSKGLLCAYPAVSDQAREARIEDAGTGQVGHIGLPEPRSDGGI